MVPTLYPYNPILRDIFEGESSRPAVAEFSAWLKKRYPDIYRHIVDKRPDLIAAKVVPYGLAGLTGDTSDDVTTDGESWSSQLTDFLQSVVPAYYQAQAQKQIIDLNIERAKHGQPPIDGGTLAPTVNVGVSGGVQKLGMLAIGGLVIFGLLTAFKRR